MRDELKIFSGTAHPSLAQEICQHLGLELGNAHISRFSNDNLFVTIEESVREDDVFVIQPSCYPVDSGLMELLLLIDALKRASAGRITAVLPYYPYARSDKKDQPRIPITARLVGDLLTTAGAQRIVTIDLHAPQIQGFFSIPLDHLTAIPILLEYFRQKTFHQLVVVAPDSGGAKLAELFSQNLHAPYAIIDKRRFGHNETVEIKNVIGEVACRDLLIIDDEISTAGSLKECVRVLKDQGARDIYVGCTHPIFSGPAVERVCALEIQELVVTNTVPVKNAGEKVKILSVAGLLAEAIHRIHSGCSISELFHQETGGMM